MPPTPCPCCAIARLHPTYALFNPACLHCGARIIQHLGTLSLPPDVIRQRRRINLAIWVEWGHNEQAIRDLAKGSTAIGPAPSSESVPLTPAKRRSVGRNVTTR